MEQKSRSVFIWAVVVLVVISPLLAGCFKVPGPGIPY